MKTYRFAGPPFLPLVGLLLLSLSPSAAETAAIPGIGPVGLVTKVRGDFQFTEGPADDGKGNLYFTDIPANRIYKLEPHGKLSVFLESSGSCNGLMFDAAGTLFACAMDGHLLAIDPLTKKVTVLADTYQGKRLNAPNDLVVDRSGGIYFTDPRFNAPQPWPQGKEAVYYRQPDGQLTRLIDDLPAPNGVILSPDEQTLYVVPSMQKEMWAYPVAAPGKPGKGRVFCTLVQLKGSTGKGSGGDGLTVDTGGNLYITSPLGIQVFSPQGKLLGLIKIPEPPANVTFGGEDRKTLYVTARTSLYAAQMEATGHAFSGLRP
jgi:gluconolactonase